MPRNYGRIATSIWRDDDFRDLSPDARFTYTMLLSQANISACGVLELTERRWAGHLGFDTGRINDALGELEDTLYLVIDEATEEVLIRTFVRWDGGANNDLRRKAIVESAAAVASPMLRDSIAVELDRIGLEHCLSKPLASPIEGRRVVVNTGDHLNNPQPTTPEGEPAASVDAEPSPFCSRHPNGTEDRCGPCGTAKMRFAAWSKSGPAREAAARVAAERRKTAAADCRRCGGSGWIETDDTTPAAKCNHLDVAS